MKSTQKIGLYLLAIVGYIIMLVCTPVAAYFVPPSNDTLNSSLMNIVCGLAVIVLFFSGGFLVGNAAKKLDSTDLS